MLSSALRPAPYNLGTPTNVKMLLEESKVGLECIVTSPMLSNGFKDDAKVKEKIFSFLHKRDKN